MSKAVYIQIFIGDWIRDTRCLSLAARGVYTELKMHLERENEKGVMDCVITELSGLLGISYSSVSPLLEEIFTKQVLTCEKLPGGRVRIIDEEMRAQAVKKAAKSRAGKEGMKKRYAAKSGKSVITDVITSVITHNDNGIDSDNGIDNENEGGAGGNEKTVPELIEIKMPWEGADFRSKWDVWKAYKWEQHQWRYSYHAEVHALEELWKMSGGKMDVAIGFISNAISKGWRNIYNKKDTDYGNNGRRTNGVAAIASGDIIKPGDSFWDK